MIKLKNTDHYLGLIIHGNEADLVEFQFYLSRLANCINERLKPKPKNRIALCNVIYSLAYDARKASDKASTNPSGVGAFKVTWARLFGLTAIMSVLFTKIRNRDDELSEFCGQLMSMMSHCLVEIPGEVSIGFYQLTDIPTPFDRRYITHPGFDTYVNALEVTLSSQVPLKARTEFLTSLSVMFFLSTPFNDSILNEIEEYVSRNNCTFQQILFDKSMYEAWIW